MPNRCQSSVNVEDTRIEFQLRRVQSADVGVEAFALPIKSLKVSIVAGVFFAGQIRTSPRFGGSFLLAGIVAVTVQREVAQVPLVESLFHDLQRGGFLAHKQDRLPISQALGNDVGNRLTLACSRRPVENKTGS